MAQRQKSAKSRTPARCNASKVACDNDQSVKLIRSIFLLVAVLMIAKPAGATSITVLVGDKDWFGSGQAGKVPGVDLLPFDDSQRWDFRSSAESSGTNGSKLTDTYSALYPNVPSECAPNLAGHDWPGCAPSTGSVVFSLNNSALLSGTITFLRGGFQCTVWGPVTANVNGIAINFCFDDGNNETDFLKTALGSITLTPQMMAAANAAGQVQLNIFHNLPRPEPGQPGSLDYFSFDYFELNADVAPVPEPAPIALVTIGLIVILISYSRAAAVRGRLRASTANRRR